MDIKYKSYNKFKNKWGNNKCFECSRIVALHHQNLRNHPERISNINFFSHMYNWEGTEFPAGIKDQKRSEKNNKTIALNILFVQYIEKTINIACKSKCNRQRKNQVVLLMVTDGKKWHYIALKGKRTDDGFNRPKRKSV